FSLFYRVFCPVSRSSRLTMEARTAAFGMLYSGTASEEQQIEKYTKEWKESHATVSKLLYQQHVSQRDWHELFMKIYQIHSWMPNGTDFVRGELSKDIEKYVETVEQRIKAQIDDNELLRLYVSEWNKYNIQTEILPLPFKMKNTKSDVVGDRQKKDQPENNQIIRDGMLSCWRVRVFNPISERIRNAALKLVDTERNGEVFDDRLVVGIRESYVILNESEEDPLAAYQASFERAFIADTVAYYTTRASQFLEDNGVSAYMEYADARMSEERERAKKYLSADNDNISGNKHMDEVTRVLVVSFMDQLLAKCADFVKTMDIVKLRQLHRLMKHTPTGMDVVVACIDEHIRSEGLADMRTSAATITTDPEKYVAALLNLFDRFSILVRDAFEDDPKLLTTRDKAFEHILNDTSIFALQLEISNEKTRKSGRVSIESKCPELLANYADLLLRRTAVSKKLSSEEIDARLNSLLLLLKYIKNKDVFMRFHKAHLSRRLVLEMSADQDKEEQMITRMRETGMPAEQVNKLFRMLQDIELNKTLSADIRSSLIDSHGGLGDIINVKVLNTGAWGKGGERIHVSLPRELEELIPPVEGFYGKMYNGRKLHWLHHWSTAAMNFKTREGASFELEVTTFQLAVLFCWNDRSDASLSLESLRVATELPVTELVRTLHSLCAMPKLKYQVLLADQKEKAPINPNKFTDSTEFTLNHAFKIVKNGREQDRGKLSLVGRLQLSLEATAKAEHEEIIALRQIRVQEAAVKVLKTRKELSLAALEHELINVLKQMFVPTKTMMKEQLEWLLENNFIARKEGKMDTFLYVS
ncbi:hypothetical protein PFISCL1PPCAC_1391, partial [Pristionchus fissidentatus]